MTRFDKQKGLELLEAVRERKARDARKRSAKLAAERYERYGDELVRSLEADLSERTDALVRGMRASSVQPEIDDETEGAPPTQDDDDHAHAG